MIYYAAGFFVIAIIEASLAFGGGVTADSAELAKMLFFVFLALSLVTLVLGIVQDFARR